MRIERVSYTLSEIVYLVCVNSMSRGHFEQLFASAGVRGHFEQLFASASVNSVCNVCYRGAHNVFGA